MGKWYRNDNVELRQLHAVVEIRDQAGAIMECNEGDVRKGMWACVNFNRVAQNWCRPWSQNCGYKLVGKIY